MRMAVLASGGGTVLQAILDADVPVEVVLVDRACGALDVARRAGVACETVARAEHLPDRVAFTEAVVAVLRRHGVDTVAMAGFMTILDKPMFEAFDGRIVNTHPSLLPSFRGARAVADALAFGAQVTGCTIHVATVEVDDGPILAQEAVIVLPDDTEERLHERIKTVERRLYPDVLHRIRRGEIRL